MTPQGSPRSNHHPKYILCRIARNPFVLFGIALLYFVHILVIRDKGNIFLSRRAQQDNVSLRASSGDTRTEVDEYIDELEGGPQWETVETPEGGHPVNNGGVKGGVEVYPLQVRCKAGRRAYHFWLRRRHHSWVRVCARVWCVWHHPSDIDMNQKRQDFVS